MSSLANQQINSSFNGLLQVPGGITSSLQTVQDGNGNPTGLQISSTGVSGATVSNFVPSISGIQVTGSVQRPISDGFGDFLSVKDFGAVGNGSTDDTAAIQAAINSISGGFTCIWFPPGTYKVTSTITISNDRIGLRGAGVASRIRFEPTADAVCILFDKGSTTTVQNFVKDIAFYSTDTSYNKTAIKLVDISSNVLDNVHTIYPHWYGGSTGSIFLNVCGRECSSFSNLNVAADKPLKFSPIPSPHVASGIGNDQMNFHNCYFIAGNYPVVTIDTGVLLTHVSFDGFQAWAGGTYGIYWNDTTSAATSLALSVKNVRWEQQVGTTGYFIYISNNYSLQTLLVENCYGAASTNFIYFRKVRYWTLKNTTYIGNQVGFDADSTCDFGSFDCALFNDAGTTINLSAKGVSGTYYVGGNSKNLIANSRNGSITTNIGNLSTGVSSLSPTAITIAAGATAAICTGPYSGMLLLSSSTALSAIFNIKGTFYVSSLLAGDNTYFGTTSGASSINVYYDSGSGNYVAQNSTGSSLSITALIFG